MRTEIKEGKKFAVSWGVSQAIQNAAFGVLYLASAEFAYAFPDYIHCAPDRMYIGMFSLLFGAFTAG